MKKKKHSTKYSHSGNKQKTKRETKLQKTLKENALKYIREHDIKSPRVKQYLEKVPEYLTVTKSEKKNFLKAEKEFNKGKYGNYQTYLFERKFRNSKRKQDGTIFVRVPLESFTPGKYYEVRIRHIKSRQSRVLSFGEIPN